MSTCSIVHTVRCMPVGVEQPLPPPLLWEDAAAGSTASSISFAPSPQYLGGSDHGPRVCTFSCPHLPTSSLDGAPAVPAASPQYDGSCGSAAGLVVTQAGFAPFCLADSRPCQVNLDGSFGPGCSESGRIQGFMPTMGGAGARRVARCFSRSSARAEAQTALTESNVTNVRSWPAECFVHVARALGMQTGMPSPVASASTTAASCNAKFSNSCTHACLPAGLRAGP